MYGCLRSFYCIDLKTKDAMVVVANASVKLFSLMSNTSIHAIIGTADCQNRKIIQRLTQKCTYLFTEEETCLMRNE